MNSDDILAFATIALIINLIILYHIIRSATKANKIHILLKIQVEILRLIALKNGVDEEEIKKVIIKHNQ